MHQQPSRSPTHLQKKLLKVVVKEAEDVAERYGRPRRTEIADVGVAEVQTPEDLIPDHKGMIVFSDGGYIKRICDSTFTTQARSPLHACDCTASAPRARPVFFTVLCKGHGLRAFGKGSDLHGVQRRGGTGKKGSKLRDDDAVRLVMTTMAHDHLVFIATNGACFSMRAYNVPERSRTSQGAPVAELLPNLQAGVGIATIVPLREHAEDRSLVLITSAGKIKRLQLSALPCGPRLNDVECHQSFGVVPCFSIVSYLCALPICSCEVPVPEGLLPEEPQQICCE